MDTRRVVKSALEALVRNWVAEEPERKKRPFHLVLLRLLYDLGPTCSSPSADAESLRRYERILADNARFGSVADAEAAINEIVDDLRSQTMPAWPHIDVVVCRRKRRDAAGKLLNCCVESELRRGCDSGAGTTYYAKTNGQFIVFAGLLKDRKARTEPFPYLGLRSSSLTLFVVLHEFGHVLYLNPATRDQFRMAEALYTESVKLVDPALRKSAGLQTGGADYMEFVASLYALESLRKIE